VLTGHPPNGHLSSLFLYFLAGRRGGVSFQIFFFSVPLGFPIPKIAGHKIACPAAWHEKGGRAGGEAFHKDTAEGVWGTFSGLWHALATGGFITHTIHFSLFFPLSPRADALHTLDLVFLFFCSREGERREGIFVPVVEGRGGEREKAISCELCTTLGYVCACASLSSLVQKYEKVCMVFGDKRA
jgi:hypothetical protein